MDTAPSVEWAAKHLCRRGLVAPGEEVIAAPLSGGVSADVVRVCAGGRWMVVKRALPKLRVQQEWLADPVRIVREGQALQVARRLVPEMVPAVIDLDEEAAILVLEHSPSDWREWRSELFAGTCLPAVASELGRGLARWHRETASDPELGSAFGDRQFFVQLRLEPFHEEIAKRHPEVAPRVSEVAQRLREAQTCLVHGDFSPKNVLAGAGGLWVLDWEVAHYGEPAFDVAYMLTHLTLKSVHGSEWKQRYRALARTFLDSYARHDGPVQPEDNWLVAQVGCLLLARVDGKSPAAYLTAREQADTRALALGLLSDPPPTALELWDRLP